MAIAGNSERLDAAAAFWRSTFEDLSLADAGSPASKAMRFARALQDDWFWKLMPETEATVAGCDQAYLVRRSGCLLSLAEVARSISSWLKPQGLLDSITALLAVGTPGVRVPPEVAALGLIGVRELFDLARRFRMSYWNSQEFSIPTCELLALHRQEGALCVAPPVASYPHAPVIHTGVGCRTAGVSLSDPTCERPGFNLVYTWGSVTDAVRKDPSLRFDVLWRNLLVVAGVDTVLLPRLHPRDELYRVWAMASAGPSSSPSVSRIRDAYRKHMAATRFSTANRTAWKSQRELFDELCVGLLRTFIDVHLEDPAVEALLNLVWLSVGALLEAHGYSPPRPWRGGDMHIASDMPGSDTYESLRAQVRWYASRRNARTLLAWRDRAGGASKPLNLTPFMTYLRFHANDAIFVGVVLRVLTRWDYLVRTWEANRATWGTALLDALPSEGWDSSGIADLRKALRTFWASARVKTQTSWHQIGLIDVLRRAPDRPAWLGDPEPASRDLLECADIVRLLVEVLERPGVLTAVSAALQDTPALWLANHGFTAPPGPAGATILVKSHSFERLQRVYAKAAQEAGVN